QYLLRSSSFENHETKMSVFGGCLGFLERQSRVRRVRVEQHRDVGFTGDKLAKKLQPLALNVSRLVGQAGNISTGPGKAPDDAGTQRVANGREDHRDGRGRCLCSLRGERSESCDQHIRPVLNKLRGQRRKSLRMSFGGTVFESHIRSLAIAELVQPLQQ